MKSPLHRCWSYQWLHLVHLPGQKGQGQHFWWGQINCGHLHGSLEFSLLVHGPDGHGLQGPWQSLHGILMDLRKDWRNLEKKQSLRINVERIESQFCNLKIKFICYLSIWSVTIFYLDTYLKIMHWKEYPSTLRFQVEMICWGKFDNYI